MLLLLLADQRWVIPRVTRDLDLGLVVLDLVPDLHDVALLRLGEDRHLDLGLDPERSLADRTDLQNVRPVLPVHTVEVPASRIPRQLTAADDAFSA